ncbi:hypothetical protein [Planococcus lenghuensis]|nr:hypothetical protein [Planococcus lenghuensis]
MIKKTLKVLVLSTVVMGLFGTSAMAAPATSGPVSAPLIPIGW